MINIRKDEKNDLIILLLYIALLFPFFSYNIIKNQEIVKEIKLISLVICSCIYIYKCKVEKFDLWVILGGIYICFTSIIKGTFGFNVLYSIMVLCIIPLMIKKQLKKSILILKALYIIAIFLIIGNAITMIGRVSYNSTYLLGGKNALAIIILPLIAIIGTYSLCKYNKITIKNYVVIIIGIISILMGESSTGIIVAVMLCLYTFTYKRIKVNSKILMIFYSVLLFLILGTNTLMQIDVVNNVVVDVFNKDFTFSGRTNIWKIATDAFVRSPILGYGKGNLIIFNSYNNIVNEAHNFILEGLLAGGIIYLFIIIKTILISTTQQDKKNIIYNWNVVNLFFYFIIGITESLIFRLEFWVMLALIASSKFLEKGKKG